MKKWSTKMLVTLAMMVALEVVLSRFLSINAWNIKIGFSFIPAVVVGILYGALPAGAMAVVADLIGALMFPSGDFFPGYTLTAFLVACVFGIFLHKKQTTGRIICAVVINQFVMSLFLQSLWISIQYSSPYLPLVATRIMQCLVMAPTQFLTIQVIVRMLGRYAEKKDLK